MASKVRIILGLPEGVFAGAKAMGVLRRLHKELASVIGSCPRPEDPKWKRAIWIFQHLPGRDRSWVLKVWRDRKGLRRTKSAYITEKINAGLIERPRVTAEQRARFVRADPHVMPPEGMPFGFQEPAPPPQDGVRWNVDRFFAGPPEAPWRDEGDDPNG